MAAPKEFPTTSAMPLSSLLQHQRNEWELPKHSAMQVPVRVYATRVAVQGLGAAARARLEAMASLPGLVGASHALLGVARDGGLAVARVAAFDLDADAAAWPAGVGLDPGGGVRLLRTGVAASALPTHARHLAAELQSAFAAVELGAHALEASLEGGARWAVAQGWGDAADLQRIEDGGRAAGAEPHAVSARALRRLARDFDSGLGDRSALRLLEVQEVYSDDAERGFGLRRGELVLGVQGGARGLARQVSLDYLRQMRCGWPSRPAPPADTLYVAAASVLGQRYLGALRAVANGAMARRQLLTHAARLAFQRVFPGCRVDLLHDVATSGCREEIHAVSGSLRRLLVHRCAAARLLAPGHPDLPTDLAAFGQPVLLTGRDAGHVLAGCQGNSQHALASLGMAHAGATRRQLDAIALGAEAGGMARRVARLLPRLCLGS